MNGKVLVLNQDFSPIMVCSVQRAFLLVFLQKAEIVRKVEGGALRTVSDAFPMPSVIRLGSYIAIPYKGVVLSRQNIFKRDNHQCVYCGTGRDLTLDHVIPKSRGGKSTWTNLVAACKTCNAKKGDQSPDQAGLVMRHAPFKPSFVIFLRDFTERETREWMPFLQTKKEFAFG